jgi:kynurenine formamidase
VTGRRTRLPTVAALVAAAFGLGLPLRTLAESWIDLSHPLSAQTLYWPTGSPFELEVLARGSDAAGNWLAMNRFRTPEHLGTHVDAPFHFDREGWKMDKIPLEQMVGPAIVIDVRPLAGANRDVAVGASVVKALEKRRGSPLPAGSIVLIRTGWDAYWSDPARYFGTTRTGDASDLHFPGLAPAAARLLAKRGVKGVGIDSASIDPGQNTLFEAHRILAEANILIFENLRGLGEVPQEGAFFYGFALPIVSGTGVPVRAVVSVK